MRRILAVTLTLASCCSSVALATDLNVTVEADVCDASTITVGPACEILYRVTAELHDTANEGLAVVVFDLEFDGADLSPADEPTELPMLNFVPPNGFSSNPEGYGGTVRNGRLVQIGGAQNVFNHGQWSCEGDGDCPAPSTCDGGLCTPVSGLPGGTLITDVASPGSPVVLVTGRLTVPSREGSYTLQVANLVANVIRQGATGDPFWATEVAGVYAVTNLSIMVEQGASCCDGPPVTIPTLSEWGLIILALLLLVVGKVYFGKRRQIGGSLSRSVPLNW